MTLRIKTLFKALIASFSVYLLPVFTVHIFYLWGWAIGAELLAGKSGREPAWLAADAALAFGLQGCALGPARSRAAGNARWCSPVSTAASRKSWLSTASGAA